MNFIKRILFQVLGLNNYLYLVSKIFFFMYKIKVLKGKPDFDCHYYVKNFIKQGDTVLDIGANLGYYSVIFAKLTGRSGKVLAVEPVSEYRNVLTKNTRCYKNVEIIPFALGKEDDKPVKLGAPVVSKYFSHGRTKVIEQQETRENLYEFTTKMYRPVTLFKDLTKLNYIKCDVEGYEAVIIPEMVTIIRKFKPIIQIEISENKKEIFEIIINEGYNVFCIKGNELLPVESSESKVFGDYIFMPKVFMQ